MLFDNICESNLCEKRGSKGTGVNGEWNGRGSLEKAKAREGIPDQGGQRNETETRKKPNQNQNRKQVQQVQSCSLSLSLSCNDLVAARPKQSNQTSNPICKLRIA
jgi:hypothetical protein